MHLGKLACVGIFFSCTLLFYSAQAAEIYKWVDSEGNVHYGERPPAHGAKQLNIRPSGSSIDDNEPATSPAKTDPKTQRDKMIKAMEGDRLARQEKKQKQHEQQQKRKMQCAQAKDTLRRYTRASSLYKLDADGNRIALPESVKQQQTKSLVADIKKWCK